MMDDFSTVITLGEQGYKVSLDLREGTRLAMAEALLNAACAPILDPEDVLLTLHLHLDPRRADNSAVMEAIREGRCLSSSLATWPRPHGRPRRCL